MMEGVRVAYTLEQCWHRVPGGTTVATLRTARALAKIDDVELVGVAGRHRFLPEPPWQPEVPVAQLPLAAPWLYEGWLHAGWPAVERATGPVDVTHATTLIPCPTKAPLVVTLHDLAFLSDPSQFTRHGNRVFRASLDRIRRHADLVLCPSRSTIDDAVAAGVQLDRLRLVPWGVDSTPAGAHEVARVRARHGLPERFALFVGTVEPRKNLARLAAAIGRLDDPLPLVVAGAAGWGDAAAGLDGRSNVSFLGFVRNEDLAGLYAAASVFCYPSEREGYGLPVLEAMAQGTAVVTSRGTATEDTAGGAAVLVDPFDVDDIARGITEALQRADLLGAEGLARAATQTWAAAAVLTAAAYREVAR